LIAGATTTVVFAIVLFNARRSGKSEAASAIASVAAIVILTMAFVQPTGLELTGSWFGWPADARWEPLWHPPASVKAASKSEISSTDPGGAGEFLQQQLAKTGPFRYVGYGGAGYPSEKPQFESYMGIWLRSNVQAILVNARPIYLGLYDIQGYDPIELDRYSQFFDAVNGMPQNYHTAYVLPTGVSSPLLNLLDLRFIVVDASLPKDREDVSALIAGKREVFKNKSVRIFENPIALPHAWIVHKVQPVTRDDALPLLASNTVDPKLTALVEGNPPLVAAQSTFGSDSADESINKPDEIAIKTVSKEAGFLVLSEVFEKGWRAYVDGKPTKIYPTDELLRGVWLPGGSHTVEFRYEPPSLRLGIWISVGTAVTMVLVSGFIAWKSFGRNRSFKLVRRIETRSIE
jgi:hypothetical protein